MTWLPYLFEHLDRFRNVLTTVTLLLPAAGAAAVGLALWRIDRGRPTGQAWSWSIAEIGMVVGTTPWMIMGLWPMDIPPDAIRWRLMPFADINTQLSGPPGEAFVQIFANMLVFLPLGAFAPVRFAGLTSAAKLLGLGAGASLALEIGQQVFVTGRVFSVDDVLLNGVGCLIGGLLTRRWWAGRPHQAGQPPRADQPHQPGQPPRADQPHQPGQPPRADRPPQAGGAGVSSAGTCSEHPRRVRW